MSPATTDQLTRLAETFRQTWRTTTRATLLGKRLRPGSSMTDQELAAELETALAPLGYDFASVARVNDEVARWHEEYRVQGSGWFGDGGHMAMCCGAYIGEMVRRFAGRELCWITYDEAVALDGQMAEVLGPRNRANSAFLVHGDGRGFLFPWAKVYQRIVVGPEHDLEQFVRTAVGMIDAA